MTAMMVRSMAPSIGIAGVGCVHRPKWRGSPRPGRGPPHVVAAAAQFDRFSWVSGADQTTPIHRATQWLAHIDPGRLSVTRPQNARSAEIRCSPRRWRVARSDDRRHGNAWHPGVKSSCCTPAQWLRRTAPCPIDGGLRACCLPAAKGGWMACMGPQAWRWYGSINALSIARFGQVTRGRVQTPGQVCGGNGLLNTWRIGPAGLTDW